MKIRAGLFLRLKLAHMGLQPRRLRFMCATMPAKRPNVTDGITNPVRLRDMTRHEARWGLQPHRLRFMCATMPGKRPNVTDGITNPVRLRPAAVGPT